MMKNNMTVISGQDLKDQQLKDEIEAVKLVAEYMKSND